MVPSVIVFSAAEPGERRTGSFVIRNDAGAYSSIWFSDPNSWVKVTGYASLQPDDELPLQVEITATGHDWGKHYSEKIDVRLDGVEAAVGIRLQTQPAAASPPYTTPTPASPQEVPRSDSAHEINRRVRIERDRLRNIAGFQPSSTAFERWLWRIGPAG